MMGREFVAWAAPLIIIFTCMDEVQAQIGRAGCSCDADAVTRLEDAAPIASISNERKPTIIIASDGNPLITYAGNSACCSVGTKRYTAHCADKSCTTFTGGASTLIATGTGNVASMAIGTDGFALVVFYHNVHTRGPAVIHCTNVACSTFEPSTFGAPFIFDDCEWKERKKHTKYLP